MATTIGQAGGAHARSTERETLLNRCWIEGVAKAGPAEGKPVKDARLANLSVPPRTLQPYTAIEAARRGAIRRVELEPGAGKLVALTFDLCEQTGEIAGYDGAIIDYLREQAIDATLFAGGKWMLTHGERAQQMMAHSRFEMANHGWAHRNTRLLDGPALHDEVVKPQLAYEEMRARLGARQCVKGNEDSLATVPRRLGLFRFPFGACNDAALQAVGEAGLLAVQWDVSSGDPSQSAAAITADVLRQVRPGSIVLFHANGRGAHTAEALPLLIPKLKAMGYRFVTVGALLAAGRPVITPTCYDSRPGDTDKYDRLVGGLGHIVPSATETSRAPSTPASKSPATRTPAGKSGFSPQR